MSNRKRGLAVVAALAVTLLLASCAAEEKVQNDAFPDLTLAETKSPVQLLRNETASRIPAALIADVEQTEDVSFACVTPENDPKGLIRSWRSRVRVQLNQNTSAEAVLKTLVTSFVDQGWKEGTYGSATIIDLTRDKSLTTIHLSTKKADVKTGIGAIIQLQVAGPCVKTAGGESDEVKLLEAGTAQ